MNAAQQKVKSSIAPAELCPVVMSNGNVPTQIDWCTGLNGPPCLAHLRCLHWYWQEQMRPVVP